MAGDTALANRVMLEHKRTSLGGVTLEAGFVRRQESQSATLDALLKVGVATFDCIALVRIVAINAAHLVLQHRMMVRQLELGPNFQVTLEASIRRFQWVNDVPPAAAGLNVLAAGTVAGFASHRFGVLAFSS